MFLRVLGIVSDAAAPVINGIDQSKWYAANINTAVMRGLISPNLSPDTPMTRTEAAGLIAKALKELGAVPAFDAAEVRALLAGFTDLGGLTASELEDIAICVKLGIYTGNSDGTMSPQGKLTSTQLAIIAIRIRDLILRG